MEEFQEADILWPESTQNPTSLINWPEYFHFTPSHASFSTSTSSHSTCTQDELQDFDLSWPGTAGDSFFFSIRNLSEEIFSDDEWQEADVLWPEEESLKHRDFKFANENFWVRDEDQLRKGEAKKISSPIDIPKLKRNKIEFFL